MESITRGESTFWSKYTHLIHSKMLVYHQKDQKPWVWIEPQSIFLRLCLQYVTYDPNYNYDDEDDDEMECDDEVRKYTRNNNNKLVLKKKFFS